MLRRTFQVPALAALGLLTWPACAGKTPTSPKPGAPVADESVGRPAPTAPFVAASPAPRSGATSPLLTALEQELKRGADVLRKQDPPAYFLGYEAHEVQALSIGAQNGVLLGTFPRRERWLDAEVRVGSHTMDSTHPILRRQFDSGRFTNNAVSLPLDDDGDAARTIAWRETERRYRAAAERFIQVRTRKKVEAAAEDDSDDFSKETAARATEPVQQLSVERDAWEKRVKALSARFRSAAGVLEGFVSFNAEANNRWIVTSEGTRLQTGRLHARVSIFGRARAEDGMELVRHESFDAASMDRLPSEQEMAKAVDAVIADLQVLRTAPLAEPFVGPAILEGRAAGVFFHETFGHRVEGHRQKDDTDGQTFTKKLGQPIMPSFLSVFDDPGLARVANVDLNGFYRFDNEGVPAQRAHLVDKGVFRGFLMARSPVRGFPKSNGHGRRQFGRNVVARQANLIVQPSVVVGQDELRQRLLAEVRRQGKPYGLLFREVQGGFTSTGRGGSQSFVVNPIVVFRVYADGRPDQMIRGADIVGTPLSVLARIRAASDRYEVFNGQCGAESGWVPVSAASPSLLVETIEVARKGKGFDRPPLLPAPTEGGAR